MSGKGRKSSDELRRRCCDFRFETDTKLGQPDRQRRFRLQLGRIECRAVSGQHDACRAMTVLPGRGMRRVGMLRAMADLEGGRRRLRRRTRMGHAEGHRNQRQCSKQPEKRCNHETTVGHPTFTVLDPHRAPRGLPESGSRADRHHGTARRGAQALAASRQVREPCGGVRSPV